MKAGAATITRLRVFRGGFKEGGGMIGGLRLLILDSKSRLR